MITELTISITVIFLVDSIPVLERQFESDSHGNRTIRIPNDGEQPVNVAGWANSSHLGPLESVEPSMPERCPLFKKKGRTFVGGAAP